MDHNIPLITTLVAGFGLALIFGFLAEQIRVPALVGYLVAGIIIGPGTPGFVVDLHLASQLSEIGIMLLMFGVGLHFSFRDLLEVKWIAVPGAVVQMAVAMLLGMMMALWWGWRWESGLILGLCLSCASTVVLLKALEARGVLDSTDGRITVGWLVVEDLVTVLVLVLLPPLSGMLGGTVDAAAEARPLWGAVVQIVLEVCAFVALMLIVGRRFLPWLLWQVARTGSRELFTLSVVASAIGIAYGAAQMFSVSFALGAFFAGMVMRESELSHRTAKESLPLRDAFSVLFFVSVGILFQPAILVAKPLHVLGVMAVIVFGKSLAALALVLAFRYPLRTALTIAASLAQIGEFSFILGGLGFSLGLMPSEGTSLILAGALISIALNPLLFAAIEPLRRFALRHSRLARYLEQRGNPCSESPIHTEDKYLEGQVVLVGYGRVGRRIASALGVHNIPYVVVEQSREPEEDLRKQGIPTVFGNAADPAVLIQAHIANASVLVVATPNLVVVRQVADIAQRLNPDIEIILRTHDEDESLRLSREGIGTVFFGEEELAKGMINHVVVRFQTS